MVKKRVHELAKELNSESKEIIKGMAQIGVSLKSHMSTLEDKDIQRYMEVVKEDNINKNADKSMASDQAKVSGDKILADDSKRLDKRDMRQDRGPGMVARVPSRPPDRRFEDTSVRNPFSRTGSSQGVNQKKDSLTNTAVKSTVFNDGEHQNLSDDKQNVQQTVFPKAAERPKYPERQRPAGVGDRDMKSATPRANAFEDKSGVGRDKRFDGSKTSSGIEKNYQKPSASIGKTFERPRSEGDKSSYKPDRFGSSSDSGRTSSTVPPRGPGIKPPMDSRPRPGVALKVPKVPEQAKGIDKLKASEKSRTRIAQNQGKTFGKDRRFGQDTDGLGNRYGSGKKKSSAQKSKFEQKPVVVVEQKPIVIGESITVQSLAEKMKKSPADLIKKLMQLEIMATINQEIDSTTAEIIANEYGFEVEIKIELDAEAQLEQEQEDSQENLVLRPCVVTVMGHVDHGKTSLLDAIRQANVIATEAGGITQHIGAYQVEYNHKKITFLDTPGHEAFTSMRARGAQVTDIAVLVVAAEDGVKPQTIEAINHAKAAGVPIVVAVNKIDKPEANPDKVKQQLTEHNLVPEEWGGDVICVPVSAKQRIGIDDLLESILLVAEVSEFKANPNRDARGTVVEAELDKGRGPVATILVQNGTLHIGEAIVAGTAFGRVRAMMDDKGKRVKKAGPSTPVEVLGFSDVPLAGDIFYVVKDEKTIKQIIDKRVIRKRQDDLKSASPRLSLEDLYKNIQEGEIKELHLVIKADVQGSMEAIRQSLERLSTDEVKVNIIHGGVGAITESDIMLASASSAIVIGFNVRPDINARKAAETEKIDIRLYRVIYDAIDDIKAAMSGLLEPELREVILGKVEIRQIFKASKFGLIAGCYVTEGKVTRDAGIRLIRDNIVVYEGKIDSLKRFKDDAKEVVQGYECGITLEDFQDLREGDVIEAFITEKIKRELA
jgi:translation initiation factor IF-2